VTDIRPTNRAYWLPYQPVLNAYTVEYVFAITRQCQYLGSPQLILAYGALHSIIKLLYVFYTVEFCLKILDATGVNFIVFLLLI